MSDYNWTTSLKCLIVKGKHISKNTGQRNLGTLYKHLLYFILNPQSECILKSKLLISVSIDQEIALHIA